MAKLPRVPSMIQAGPARRLRPRRVGVLVIGVIAVAALVAGGMWLARGQSAREATPSPSSLQSAGGSTPSPSPTPLPSATVSPPGSPTPPGSLSASDAGIEVRVDFDRSEVAPAGTFTAKATIHNDRGTPLVYGIPICGAAATMTLTLALPLEPAGRSWTGISAQFKDYVLEHGYGPGVAPARQPVQVEVPHLPCSGYKGDRTLAAGASIVTTLSWKAEIVGGVAALPGYVPFTITFQHDPVPQPTPVPQPSPSPAKSRVPIEEYQELQVEGVMGVVGKPSKVVSAGQAIDALLADRGFSAWLAQTPVTSWDSAHILLENSGRTSIVPAGPSWEIQLFRNEDHQGRTRGREFVLGFVDPAAGTVRSINYCNAPCSR